MKLKTLLFSILSLLLIILWSATFIAVFKNEKNEIQTELYNNSKNVAQSLSLSLSNAHGDKTLMKTMINAVFDGGHFNKIILKDKNNNLIYKRIKEIHEYQIPNWFKQIITLKAPVANANVSNGWIPFGIIYVQNDIEYAYFKLYKIFLSLIFIYLFAAILSIIILEIILTHILKPLNKIKQQANNIINKKFVKIEKLPFIKELRDVTIALNKMVEKLQIMFESANKEIIKLKQKEYIEPVTKLYNRKYYIEKLNSLINHEENILEGINIFIMLKNLEEANKKLGRTKIDEMLKEITNEVKNFLKDKVLSHHKNKFIFARLNGSEFAIFIPNINKKESEKIIKLLKIRIEKIVKKYTNIIEVVIGAYVVTPKTSFKTILSNTDKALAAAEITQDKIKIIDSKEPVLYSKEKWKEILTQAIKENNFDFLEYKAINIKNKTIHHKTLSLCLKLNNKILKYSEFIPAAIHLDMLDEIYKIALKKLISLKLREKHSFKLPFEFINKTSNFLYIEKTFKNIKTNYQLILEIPEKFISEDINAAKELVEIFNKNKIKFGIYNFIAESKNFNYIIELSPEFIKSDKNFYINQSKENLIHLKNIAITTESDLIATGVNNEKELNILEKKGIYIIQGKITEKI